jgi:hypothetical protein
MTQTRRQLEIVSRLLRPRQTATDDGCVVAALSMFSPDDPRRPPIGAKRAVAEEADAYQAYARPFSLRHGPQRRRDAAAEISCRR